MLRDACSLFSPLHGSNAPPLHLSGSPILSQLPYAIHNLVLPFADCIRTGEHNRQPLTPSGITCLPSMEEKTEGQQPNGDSYPRPISPVWLHIHASASTPPIISPTPLALTSHPSPPSPSSHQLRLDPLLVPLSKLLQIFCPRGDTIGVERRSRYSPYHILHRDSLAVFRHHLLRCGPLPRPVSVAASRPLRWGGMCV